MNKYFYILSIFFMILSTILFAEQGYQAKVIAVIDGDTIKVLKADHTQVKIRLAEIDCPEKKQPYGAKAKQRLSDKIYERSIFVEPLSQDRYGRVVAKLYLDEQNINRYLVAEGYCWVYPRYAKDKQLFTLQEEAKQAQKGLWHDAKPIPPWIWRHHP